MTKLNYGNKPGWIPPTVVFGIVHGPLPCKSLCLVKISKISLEFHFLLEKIKIEYLAAIKIVTIAYGCWYFFMVDECYSKGCVPYLDLPCCLRD